MSPGWQVCVEWQGIWCTGALHLLNECSGRIYACVWRVLLTCASFRSAYQHQPSCLMASASPCPPILILSTIGSLLFFFLNTYFYLFNYLAALSLSCST